MTQNDTVIVPLATKLKVFRAVLDLKQVDLGRATELDSAVICRYEDGLNPSEGGREKLERFFGSGIFDDQQVSDAIGVIYRRLKAA